LKANVKLLTLAERKEISEMVVTPAFQNLIRCVSSRGDLKLLEKINDEAKAAETTGEDSHRFTSARLAQQEADKCRAFVEIANDMKRIGMSEKKEYFVVEILPTLE